MAQVISADVEAAEIAKVTASLAAVKRDPNTGLLVPPVEPAPKKVESTDETIKAAGGTLLPPPEPPAPLIPTIGPGELKPRDAAQVQTIIAEQYQLSPEEAATLQAHIAAGNPMPRVEVEGAKRWLRSFMADKVRIKALEDGDPDVARDYNRMNALAAMPVVDMTAEEWKAKYGPKAKKA